MQDSVDQIRLGRWLRSEDLLWGNLTQAVKGVALSRGDELADQQSIKEYAENLGNEWRDHRVRDAFIRLAGFSDPAERVRESNTRADHLIALLEDVSGAVQRLWEMLPVPEPVIDQDLWTIPYERYSNLQGGDEDDR